MRYTKKDFLGFIKSELKDFSIYKIERDDIKYRSYKVVRDVDYKDLFNNIISLDFNRMNINITWVEDSLDEYCFIEILSSIYLNHLIIFKKNK